MFHGKGQRNGKPYPYQPRYRPGDEIREPLKVVRNGLIVPEVFSPAGDLVVSERLQHTLKQLPNIAFCPVVFEKLFSYSYSAGDFSFWETIPGYYDDGEGPERFAATLPDIPEFHCAIGQFYELVLHHAYSLARSHPWVRPQSIRVEKYDVVNYVILSPDVLRNYPIYEAEYGFILSPAAFHIMDSCFDRVYYHVAAVS